jgi:hypothetical protein
MTAAPPIVHRSNAARSDTTLALAGALLLALALAGAAVAAPELRS